MPERMPDFPLSLNAVTHLPRLPPSIAHLPPLFSGTPGEAPLIQKPSERDNKKVGASFSGRRTICMFAQQLFGLGQSTDRILFR